MCAATGASRHDAPLRGSEKDTAEDPPRQDEGRAEQSRMELGTPAKVQTDEELSEDSDASDDAFLREESAPARDQVDDPEVRMA